MKFYETFRKVEECENLLGHSVFVKTQKAILLKVKMNGKLFARYLQQHFPKVFKNGTIRSKKHNERQA